MERATARPTPRWRSIVVWGDNEAGQYDVPSPNSGFVAVAAGSNHNLGLKRHGSVVLWGRNNYHQCDLPNPNSGFVAIAAGNDSNLGLKLLTLACDPRIWSLYR